MSSISVHSEITLPPCPLLHREEPCDLKSGIHEWRRRRRSKRSHTGDLRTSNSVKALRWGEERKKEKSGKRRGSWKSSPPFLVAHGQGDGSCWRGGGGGSSLPNLHVIGREKAVGASAHSSPPALINHLDVGDDVVGVERDLVIASWNVEKTIKLTNLIIDYYLFVFHVCELIACFFFFLVLFFHLVTKQYLILCLHEYYLRFWSN